MVEANIRYLPLYPDDEGVIFNEEFLKGSENILGQLLPEYKYLEKVIRVIDIPKKTDGKVFAIAMNGEIEEALGYLSYPTTKKFNEEKRPKKEKEILCDRRCKTDEGFLALAILYGGAYCRFIGFFLAWV